MRWRWIRRYSISLNWEDRAMCAYRSYNHKDGLRNFEVDGLTLTLRNSEGNNYWIF